MSAVPEDVRALAEAAWASTKRHIGDREDRAVRRIARAIMADRAARPSVPAVGEALTFVSGLTNPNGPFRCGPLADVLYRIVQLAGRDASIVVGEANGVDHVWVVCDGGVHDPSAGQFGGVEINYRAFVTFRPELFVPPVPDTREEAIREARLDAFDECMAALSYAGVVNGCDVLRARMGAMQPAERQRLRAETGEA